MIIISDFGKFIKQLRKDRGLSLKEVAKKGGLSHPYISQIENGKRSTPKPEIINKLSIGLDVDYMQLLETAGYLPKIKKAEEIIHDVETMREISKGKWKQATPEDIKRMQDEQDKALAGKVFNFEDLLSDGFYIKYKGEFLSPEQKRKIIKFMDYFL
ncbi:helix-turn-helix domain-containing protein [Sutcliffiella halmapala]|uniref:helix-turn-helix domain-containing protein n=1 Tax=Sutcliffiella halmapala TaxID=79882 RepID=UPI0009952098|nr:helix-turn-helix transcriptional regulator [Sutcliffiella halmapala]